MSRATVWPPLCETDPTPGEPDEVVRAGRRYAAMAKEINGQVRRLNDLVSGTLQGGYVQSLTKAADGLKTDLGLTSRRYREVGGVLQQWAPQLTGFQDEAEGLRQAAVTAQGDMSDNRVIPTMTSPNAPPPPDAQVAAAKARQGRYDDANGDLSRVKSRLADLTERRDTAASRIADAIRDTCDDAVANSAWDSFKDWMDEHHELISEICDKLGYIALAVCVVALFVPGLNVLAAGLLIAATVGHTMLAATDHGSWGAVAMDVANLATLGAAGIAVRLFTETSALVRGAAALKAAEEVATAARVAEEVATAARLAEEAATGVRAAEEAATAVRAAEKAASAEISGAARLEPYGGPGGGHHVPAKSAFKSAEAYDVKAALAVPNAEMEALGVSHSAITGAQMTGYRAFARTGATLGWSDIATIESNALVRGGMESKMAIATVNKAIQALKAAGVAGPTRIPWGG